VNEFEFEFGTGELVGDTPVDLRLWRTASREYIACFPDGPLLTPASLSAAFRSLADYTLLLHAYNRFPEGSYSAPSSTKEDVAIRYGRYMHYLSDLFRDIANKKR
jgi:hypothetical protein